MNYKTTRQADGDIIDIYVHGFARLRLKPLIRQPEKDRARASPEDQQQ